MFQILLTLAEKQDEMDAKLDLLIQEKRVSSKLDIKISKCSTTEEFDTLLNELKEEEHFIENLEKCKRIGGSSFKEMTSKLLSSYMSKTLMCQYSLQGQRQKKAFNKTELFEVILGSVMCNFPDTTKSDVCSIIAARLRNAPKLKDSIET